MGLAVAVGLEDVEPGAFEAINALLREHRLPEHREPEIGEEDAVEFEMGGYGPLHYLRRIAAHVQAGRRFPEPGDENAHEDSVLMHAYEWSTDQFAHLILHSDAEGFYVPVDFASPLTGDVPGETVGSSVALRRELLELRRLLGIPEGIDPDGDELWDASERQGEGEGWRRYGVESFVCVRLLAAAEASVAHGAALAFI